MVRIVALVLAACLSEAWAQQYTTPIPILKQINRHNEDGSYSYGYEGADGSFKIETKHASGEVYGKYGYVDDSGQLREVEYGASRRGFEPAGTGINVAPPTLTNTYRSSNNLGPDDQDDGQYREDPSIYYKDDRFNSRPSAPSSYSAPANQYRSDPPRRYDTPQSYDTPLSRYYKTPAQQDSWNSWNSWRPTPVDPNQFYGHPASNVDINTGSYSLTYSG